MRGVKSISAAGAWGLQGLGVLMRLEQQGEGLQGDFGLELGMPRGFGVSKAWLAPLAGTGHHWNFLLDLVGDTSVGTSFLWEPWETFPGFWKTAAVCIPGHPMQSQSIPQG